MVATSLPIITPIARKSKRGTSPMLAKSRLRAAFRGFGDGKTLGCQT
jgi:hypothetical protein